MGIQILFLYKKYACKSKNKLGCISIVNVHISQDMLMHIFSTIRLFLLTCPILIMCLPLTWSFIFLYFQSQNVFHTFLTTTHQLPEWHTSNLLPSWKAKKILLQRQSPTPDKTLHLRWDTWKLLKLQVRTHQMQPVPFPEKLTGLRLFAELDELSRSPLQVINSCLHKYQILHVFYKWRTKLQEERSGSKRVLKFYTYYWRKKKRYWQGRPLLTQLQRHIF